MPEFFYRDEHGKPQDADRHNPILEAGDHAAALAISERVKKRRLLGEDFKLKHSEEEVAEATSAKEAE